MDPPKNHGLDAFCMRVKLGHGNVGFVLRGSRFPLHLEWQGRCQSTTLCKSLRIKGDDRPGGQGETIDADRMRASSRFRATLEIGQRQRHLISWNRITKETGSELIQAMALIVQNCHGNKPDTDQHRQLHSSFS
jgi:hypothetical protein